jgi:hypothetical protein
VEGDSAQALEEPLELGLSTGRLRALYAPGGEQGALQDLPAASRREGAVRERSRSLAGALGARRPGAGAGLVERGGPGAYSLNLVVEGRELSLRLDRSGARINSIVA